MSFASDILTLLKSSTALNAAVDGIYYQLIPDNPDLTKKYVVYTFVLSDSIGHLQKNNELDIYRLTVVVIAQDTGVIDAILGHIRTLLDNYSGGRFLDIEIEATKVEPDGEREQFLDNITYKIIYQN